MIYTLFLILNINGTMIENKQSFHSLQSCSVALEQVKKDESVIVAICEESK